MPVPPRSPDPHRRDRLAVLGEALAVLSVYALMVGRALRPTFDDLGGSVLGSVRYFGGISGECDTNLGMWILSWGWKALTRHPTALFDAPFLHPARRTLAGAEHALGLQPLFGPVFGLSDNPVLAYQVTLLLCFAGSGAAMYALLRHWHAGRAGAFFGGFVWSLCPVHVMQLGEPQLAAGLWLPLALLTLDRTLVGGRIRDAAGFALFFSLHLLTSYYMAYMAILGVAGYGAGVLLAGRRTLHLRGLLLAGSGAAVAGGVLLLVTLPYFANQRSGMVPVQHAPGLVWWTSAEPWRNYLIPVRGILDWGWPLRKGGILYVGAAVLVLAAIGLRRSPADAVISPARRWAPAAALGFAAVCWAFALGPRPPAGWPEHLVMPYALAERWLPGFGTMRVVSRLGIGVMVGMAALAGLGLDRLVRRFAWRPPVQAVVVAVLLSFTWWDYALPLANLSIAPRPGRRELPRIYRRLATRPPGPLLELPTRADDDLGAVYLETLYMYRAIFHGFPILNGSTGYVPPSHAPVMSLARVLPDERALDLLIRTTGLRYVVLHAAGLNFRNDVLPWFRSPRLRRIATAGSDHLFRVRGTPVADLQAALLDDRPRDTTLTGTPLAPLAPAEISADFQVLAPAPTEIVAGAPLGLQLTVVNRSSRAWPALGTRPDGLVVVAAQWQRTGQPAPEGPIVTTRLPFDLSPGERVTLLVRTPSRPAGDYLLHLGLQQDERWLPVGFTPLPITVTRPDLARP